MHALLVHSAAIERGGLLVLLQLLSELVASETNQTQQLDAVSRAVHPAEAPAVLRLFDYEMGPAK